MKLHKAPKLTGYPLTTGQSSILLHQKMFPESTAYHISIMTTLPNGCRLSNHEVEQLVLLLANRHSSLRTVVREVDGNATQIILPNISPNAKHFDLFSEMQPTEFLRAELSLSFDIEMGPLFRVINIRKKQSQQLTWIFHHLICDGVSLETLSADIVSYCERKLPIEYAPVATLNYVDYAWHVSQMESQERDANYWRTHLDGYASRLRLPVDYIASDMSSQKKCAEFGLASPDNLMEAIDSYCRKNKITPFSILLSVFAVLMRNISSAEDLVIGVPLAGRNAIGIRNIVGFFANIGPIRFQFSDITTFSELVQYAQSKLTGAMLHQGYPLEKIIKDINFNRQLTEFPLTSVFFNMINLKESEAQIFIPEVGHRSLPFDSKIEQDWYVVRRGHQLFVACHYDVTRFSPQTIEFLVRELFRLTKVLLGAVDKPLAIIADPARALPIVSPRHDDRGFCVPLGLVTAFEDAAKSHPGRIAICDSNVEMSYTKLNEARNALAARLVAEGVTSDTVIALMCKHDVTMIVAVLAVLTVGATYVPIDIRLPHPRQRFIIEDSNADVIAAPESLIAHARAVVPHSLTIISLASRDATDRSVFKLAAKHGNKKSGGYILYTSGSTGFPKGVTQTESGAYHHVTTYVSELAIEAEDILTLFAPLCFDAAVIDIFAALTTGAKLVIMDLYNNTSTTTLIHATGITILHCTPTVFRTLFRGIPSNKKFNKIRLFVLGGELLTDSEIQVFRRIAKLDARLVNLYGATECSIVSMKIRSYSETFSHHPENIGVGSGGAELIIEHNGSAAGPLVEGELIVHCPYVTPGYHNSPRLEGQLFSHASGKRWYRTGDLGVRKPNGSICIVGRTLHHVKINGIRVDLGEIERVARNLQGVEEVACIRSHEDHPSIAVVCTLSHPISERALREHLAAYLPLAMWPATIHFVPEIPKTISGKIDRVQIGLSLSAFEKQPAASTEERTPLQASVAALATNAIGCAIHNIDESLLALGANSLQAMTILARIKTQYAVELSIKDLLVHPTVREIATRVEEALLAGLLLSGPAGDLVAII